MTDVYGDAAGFRAYHQSRGRSVDAYSDDAVVNAGLLVTSEWIDGKFRSSFSGMKVGQRAQVREWPRNGAVDWNGYVILPDTIPVEAVNATYEAAWRELQSPGSLSIDWTPSLYKRTSVDGAISVEYYTAFTNVNDVQSQFIAVERAIAPILTGSGDVSGLSGAACRV